MMAKFAAFDLEIAKVVEDGADWKTQWPLGISCAAAIMDDDLSVYGFKHYQWTGVPRMLPYEAQGVVADLEKIVANGYQIVTFNGAGFDFHVLAETSGEYARCEKLALDHIDIMFAATTLRGHYVGLDSACEGMHVKGKLKEVTLNDGTLLTDMHGGRAPELWAAGEYNAVLAYLREDVRSLLDLAHAIEAHRQLRCIGKSGKPYKFRMPKLYTVRQCLTDVIRQVPSWVKDPVDIWDMVAWMPGIKWG